MTTNSRKGRKREQSSLLNECLQSSVQRLIPSDALPTTKYLEECGLWDSIAHKTKHAYEQQIQITNTNVNEPEKTQTQFSFRVKYLKQR